MRKIYFKGYYGFKNIGDDTFTISADWICKNQWNNIKPIFIGKDLPKLSDNAIIYQSNNKVLRKITEIFISIKAKYIIYFGGSVLSQITGLTDIKYHYNKWSLFNNKLGTIGTSIGPFRNEKDKKNVENFLSKFNFVSARDYSSVKVIEEMKIKNTGFSFDPAILISEVYPELKKRKKNKSNEALKIGISLCHYERYKGKDRNNEKEREESILKFIDGILKKYNEIDELVFFVFNGNEIVGDIEITNKFYILLRDKINCKIIDYSRDTEYFCKEYNKCDFILGTRLHSGILAYSMKIPFMLVEYHPKCTDFLDTINNNYRFEVKNIENSIENFNKIISNSSVPELISPDYFKGIMLNEITKIKKIVAEG